MATDLIPVIQQAMQGPKSTVLKPLGWLMVILLGGSISGSKWGSPGWLVAALGVAACITFIVYIWAYIYFSRKDPDLLRSEGYLFRMQALKEGWIGDSVSGWKKTSDAREVLLIEASNPEDEAAKPK
jgi:hypothetical protein